MGLARLSEGLPDEASDRIGFFAPSLALVSLASEVFASSGAREAGSFPNYPLVTFRSPPEYDRLAPPSSGFLPGWLPPRRFFPLRRLKKRVATYPQEEPPLGLGCLLSVSTLSRPSSTRNLPALFHAGNVRGVVPFRDGVVCRVVHPFGCRNPLVVGRSLHFRAWYPANISASARVLNRAETSPLMGFILPRGSALSARSPKAFPSWACL
jgi:hypothetical protein